MTALKAHEVARFLQRPDLSEGAFLAYGPDGGLVRETAQRLVRHFAGPDGAGASIIVLEGSELDADPGRLAVEARTNSLFGERKVLRVRNAGKSLVMPLSAFLDDPGGTVVVLEAGNLLPKDALRALVETNKRGRALPCYPDTEESLTALINGTFQGSGIRAEPDVVSTLRDTLGNDREITRRELEKLVLFALEDKVLTRADVLALCADNGALAIDDVLDAAGTGHLPRCDAALSRALANGVDPQRLLGTALQHFAALRRARAEIDRGKPAREVVEAMRPKPHFSRRAAIEQQLRFWRDGSLAEAIARLQEAVRDTRLHPALSEPLLRQCLIGLCQESAKH